MLYNYKGEDYLLHLVDTPGHVDFRAEVSRSYASCGGALLLVDASQGVQAQTVSNFYLAYSLGLKLIPVINKIDLDHADIERSMNQIESAFELDRDDAICISAKAGTNIEAVLPAVVDRIPPPTVKSDAPFRCLLVDSWFDTYLGVVLLVYVVDGSVRKGQKILSAHTKAKYEVKDIGIMYPDRVSTGGLRAGQVGYIVPGMKNSTDAFVGDTYMHLDKIVEPLPGFEETKPMVFVGAFPAEGTEFTTLEESLMQLTLNDRSVTITKETSNALGQGWRLGFLGALHASVFRDRLDKEHGASIIITAPTVPYKVIWKTGEEMIISNPDDFPGISESSKVQDLQEPFVEALIAVPQEYIGVTIKLCDDNRGIQNGLQYLSNGQALIKYYIPMAELVSDFFGKLKGLTKGYGSLDYEDAGYRSSKLVKLELLVNGKSVDALAQVMHRSQTETKGREWVKNFKEYLKNYLFEVVVQAKAGGKIVARETVKAKRKDVLAKLHASDISRRSKLLKKQKEGKKNMKMVGNVRIPQEAYQSFLAKN
ncbi:hypothetical protein D0Z00_002768 [Geotrichum galactomycetum]|uniref:Uncharacterized protein n=1 Tax=Geotrichum galactomycetum TaxID=27317 RepID=A0ACB6V3E8_9ASCO|nr:hypothetical protein D0Z00_002768 [Geotrichum candidum]